ncbi:MAG: S8 family serine peptidase [Trueperaceae bacterium]
MAKVRLVLGVLFVLVLAACSGEPQSRVTVVIDPGLFGDSASLRSGRDLTTAAITGPGIEAISIDGQTMSYMSNQLIVKFPTTKAQEDFLKRFGGTVLNTGAIPAAPATVDPKKIRKLPDLGY